MKFTDTLKELEAKATDGPWDALQLMNYGRDDQYYLEDINGSLVFIENRSGIPVAKKEAAELIAYLRNHAKEIINLVEAAEKISANIADSSSLRVWFEDLIALKNTVAALNKEQS